MAQIFSGPIFFYNYIGSQNFLEPKLFRDSKLLGTKYFLDPEILVSYNFSCSKIFATHNFSCSKIFQNLTLELEHSKIITHEYCIFLFEIKIQSHFSHHLLFYLMQTSHTKSGTSPVRKESTISKIPS